MVFEIRMLHQCTKTVLYSFRMENKIYIRIFICFLLVVFKSPAQDFQWAKSIGSDKVDRVSNVEMDVQGNIYIAGDIADTVDFDPGTGVYNILPFNTLPVSTTTDGYLAKYDPDGNLLWAFHLGNGNNDKINDIALDDDGNVYVIGVFSSFMDADPGPGTFYLYANTVNLGVCIIKYSPAGNFIWGKSISGGVTIDGNSLAIDKFKNVILTGYFSGSAYDFDPGQGVALLTSQGSFDCFVLKLDSIGNYLWAKSMGGSGDDRGTSVTVDQAGSVLSTGIFSGTVDFDPGPNVFNLSGNNNNNTYIQKLDPAGNLIWVKAFNSTNYIVGQSIVCGLQNEVYLTGLFQGTVDFDPGSGVFAMSSVSTSNSYIARLGASGNFKWARQLSGDFNQPNHITYDPQSALMLTGFFSGTVDFDPGSTSQSQSSSTGSWDMFIEKLDTSGSFLWIKTIGQPGADLAMDAAINLRGNICVVGQFDGLLNVDSLSGTQLNSKGLLDIVLVKYNQPFNCPRPKGLSSANISSTSATLNWTAPALAISYQVRYRKAGILTWSYRYASSNSLTLTGLLANTQYQWQVRTRCSLTPLVNADWTSTRTFQTNLRLGDDGQLISDEAKNNLIVFPNPAKSMVTVVSNAGTDSDYHLQMFNSTGQVVHSQTIRSIEGVIEITIDVSDKAAGLYTIVLSNGSDIEMTRLLIQ